MAWIVPENQLDEEQRDFLENVDLNRRNVWIRGFPGSGKSVLLAYTFKKIINDNPEAEVAVVVFTHSLIKMFQAAFAEMGLAANIMTYYAFMDDDSHYDYVLTDEVQDLTVRVLQEMNDRADHVVVAGDENQSIFEDDPRYHEPTVSPDDIHTNLSTIDRELHIIHRLSSSIINAVQALLPGTNIFTARRDMNRPATQIRLCRADSFSEEARYILQQGERAVGVGQTVAILVPSHEYVLRVIQGIIVAKEKPRWEVSTNNYGKVDYTALNSYLSRNGIRMQYIGNGYGRFAEDSNKINVMTYYSAKGLDFDNVFIPGLNDTLLIHRNDAMAKRLFMVAMTRSRNNLYLTYSERQYHQFIRCVAANCNSIDIHDNLAGQGPRGGNVFGF